MNEHSLSMAHKMKWLAMLEERKNKAGAVFQDYELSYAYNEIGVAYGNCNMIDEASEAFRRSIKILQGLNGYDDAVIGWPGLNLGFIYWLQGELDDAEKMLMKSLKTHEKVWGCNDNRSFK